MLMNSAIKMTNGTILQKTALQILSLIRSGEVSAETVLSECHRRIRDIDHLNAFITVVDNPNPHNKGRLSGVPFAVKDNFNTTGVRTTCGSKMLSDYIPSYTATIVDKLCREGAVMVGKTNMDEFAMGSGSVDSIYGPVRNPWLYDITESNNPDWLISGGSSGGSAVAVATGACYFALGSDTGGSVRFPAAMCGVVGFKPSYGSVSRHGLISLANSLDVPGLLTRSVDDTLLIHNIIAGHDPLDSTTLNTDMKEITADKSVEGLVVGIPKEYHVAGMSSEIIEAWSWVAQQFESAGAKVVQVSLPHTKHSASCYHILSAAEVASNMARFDGLEYGHYMKGNFTEEMFARSRSKGFNSTVIGRIMAGNYYLLNSNYRKYYEKALKIRRLISDDFNRVFAQETPHVDILLTPVTMSTSIPYLEYIQKPNQVQTQKQDVCTQAINLAGLPAISVPVKLSKAGLPVSMQLVSSYCDDKTLFTGAKFLESLGKIPLFKFCTDK